MKLWQSAGTARWVYNYTISMQRMNYRFNKGELLSDQMIRKHITKMKKRPKYYWLNLVSNNIAKQAVKDACDAYKKWFHAIDGSSNLYVEIPKYKTKKKTTPSFYNDSTRIKVKDKSVLLEKIGWVKTNVNLPVNKKLYNPRISFDGKYWYLAVGLEVDQITYPISGTLGIYLDGTYPVVLSTGEKFTSINQTDTMKKLEKKLARLKLQYRRKIRMNEDKLFVEKKNLHKLEIRIQLIYRKISNIRENYWYHVTTTILKKRPEKIVISYLPLHELMKKQEHQKRLSKECYYELKRQLHYKCEELNIDFTEVAPTYPCSKICYRCKSMNFNLLESGVVYQCLECNNTILKDRNTSLNLVDYSINWIM